CLDKVTPHRYSLRFPRFEKIGSTSLAETRRELSLPWRGRTSLLLAKRYQCSPCCIRPERRPGIAPGSRGWRPRVLLLNHHRKESRRRESHPPSPHYQ